MLQHGGRGAGGLLFQHRVLLGHLVHAADGAADLFDAGRLQPAAGRDARHQCRHLLYRSHQFFHHLTGGAGQLVAVFSLGHRVAD
ncbi:MAG TPA: hypothetical protein VGD52_17185 [Pseudoduganella sp.]